MTTYSERLCLVAANLWGVEFEDIMRRNRFPVNVVPRQAVMHVIRELKDWSYPTIGRIWGMDHTTIMYGIERSKRRIDEEPDYAAKFTHLMSEGERLNDHAFEILRPQMIRRIDQLQPRLYTREVCALAGFGPSKLRRRIAEGTFPPPVDRGVQNLFDRDEVLRALNIGTKVEAPVEETAQW